MVLPGGDTEAAGEPVTQLTETSSGATGYLRGRCSGCSKPGGGPGQRPAGALSQAPTPATKAVAEVTPLVNKDRLSNVILDRSKRTMRTYECRHASPNVGWGRTTSMELSANPKAATSGNRADLFVDGADFYRGSALKAGRLKDGWCRFRVLAENQGEGYFGHPLNLSAIWYLATQVSPRALRSFEEHKRQSMWLGTQDADVTRIIVNDAGKKPTQLCAQLSGGEFRCRTVHEAISMLRKTPCAPNAMVISADHEQPSPLLSFLDERYGSNLIVLVPPDLELGDGGRRHQALLSHDDLFEARLPEPLSEGRISWDTYTQSKDRGILAGRWYGEMFLALHSFLSKRLNRVPSLELVDADVNLREQVQHHVVSFLTSIRIDNKRLAQDPDCIEFMARKLIASVAEEILAGRAPRTSSPMPDSEQVGTGDLPPLPEQQESSKKVLGMGERGHYQVKKLTAWANKAQVLFPWIQTIRWVKGNTNIPLYPSRIDDDSHLAEYLRYLPELRPSRVIPVILNASFSDAAWDRVVRLSIILAKGTTEAQRKNAIRALRLRGHPLGLSHRGRQWLS